MAREAARSPFALLEKVNLTTRLPSNATNQHVWGSAAASCASAALTAVPGRPRPQRPPAFDPFQPYRSQLFLSSLAHASARPRPLQIDPLAPLHAPRPTPLAHRDWPAAVLQTCYSSRILGWASGRASERPGGQQGSRRGTRSVASRMTAKHKLRTLLKTFVPAFLPVAPLTSALLRLPLTLQTFSNARPHTTK